ncbi:aconitate hydratase [Candidatus Acidianus copahuensis]|uniref:Aconitate hydratase n=1 Tax=Candidatus Acidianus copahuensis TaxID=1160895 RepID=A0A031LM60_9CREN|nr:aconitate hydratase AcnA [Candidatus Acidianus copahuensis]EZQ02407.1 aconitate hydratase [Candidatus Acidianus copahuensis]
MQNFSGLPYSLRILAINISKHLDGEKITKEDLSAVLNWEKGKDFAFMPTRVVMQDYTGIPLLVDLASMRSEIAKKGKDPTTVNPKIQSDLIIDHSIQVDYYGTSYSLEMNMKREFERNEERYRFLKWAQGSFKNLRIFPPGKGIIHQINLEYLGKVITNEEPEIVIGTDSHTTMINGLGILGWGVGGLEAEAVMLGEPYYAVVPEVIGVRLIGNVKEGVTTTDVVLTITETLRKRGVVGKYVEFFGPSLKKLSVPDRATISNMAPEYGATVGYFPIDEQTIKYLDATGRDGDYVEKMAKQLGIYYADEPKYTDIIEIDLGSIEPSIAGPKNPDERKRFGTIKVERIKRGEIIEDGSVVIAAITSCTNTSNPSVMIGAGILAKKAIERGLQRKPYVKTSMAPGSPVVIKYLKEADLLPYLEALGFHPVGFGCTTCIGNAGPLPEKVKADIEKFNIDTYAVISGNRNYEGRINPLLKGTYLASPILVVAYAISGKIDMSPEEPIDYDPNGRPIFLKDLWPSMDDVSYYMNLALKPEFYKEQYSTIFKGDENWEKLDVTTSTVYNWPPSSYIVNPPWFSITPSLNIENARILLLLGDKITTDHISPAGPISPDSDAGKYLREMGVTVLNTFGARRGNHEVMLRGGFSNPKLKNFLVDREGGYTMHFPDRKIGTVYEIAMQYKSEKKDLVIVAGKQYGSGSSRDWAAKVTALLGVKAVLAESFERIHRSNLVAMGILPIEIDNWKSLGITGEEEVSIKLLDLKPRSSVTILFKKDGKEIQTNGKLRVDTKVEMNYIKEGGLLNYILKKIENE